MDEARMSSEDVAALGEAIAEMAALIDAATHRFLTQLRAFDAAEGWGRAEALSCAHWLSWRVGMDLGAAREKVRVARMLAALPRIDAALAGGRGLVFEGAGDDPRSRLPLSGLYPHPLRRCPPHRTLDRWGRDHPRQYHPSCRRHHRSIHEHGFSLAREHGEVVFRDPVGRVLESAPTRPPRSWPPAGPVLARGGSGCPARPVDLRERVRAHLGAAARSISPATNAPGWDGWPIDADAYFSACIAPT